ncbi:MAG TPA: hypothetical protein PK400_13095, partial [Phycisphaerales bacterium]|nr:hypothetical protein [Phycisphaerales bacterium]
MSKRFDGVVRCAQRMFLRAGRAALASLAATLCFAPPAFSQCNYEVTAIIQAPPCPFIGAPPTRG